MSACPCPIILGDCIGVNSPITGISSLADDQCYSYTSCCPRADAFAPPTLGGGIVTQACACVTLAATTQAEADALAAAACGGPPPPPPHPSPPTPPPPPLPLRPIPVPCTIPDFTCALNNYQATCEPGLGGMNLPVTIIGTNFPPGWTVTPTAGNPNSVDINGGITHPGDYPSVPGVNPPTITLTDVTGYVFTSTYAITSLGLTNWPPTPYAPGVDGYVVPLPDAGGGDAYSYQLVSAGGTAPITFSVDPANIPGWMTVSPSGLITGTPAINDNGTNVAFDVTMTDSQNRSCTQMLSIDILCQPALKEPLPLEVFPGHPVLIVQRTGANTFLTGSSTWSLTSCDGQSFAFHLDIWNDETNVLLSSTLANNISGGPINACGGPINGSDSGIIDEGVDQFHSCTRYRLEFVVVRTWSGPPGRIDAGCACTAHLYLDPNPNFKCLIL